MNSFTVVWLDQAVGELAGYWLESDVRDEITRAVAEIDQQLRHGPENKGSEVSEGLRKLVVPPLRVFYSVQPENRMVEVSSVRLLT
jgi:hypothetical protein